MAADEVNERVRKFQTTIEGESHTLWHGFDKTVAEQTVARRTMMVNKCIKEHFVAKSLGDAAADWRWWKDNLLDSDSETGVIYVSKEPRRRRHAHYDA